jgi:putative flavoprotein involved in K+ transport
MSNSVYDVIVIGAGHAGLSVSYFLKKQGLNHVIFERGRIGESWRSQRWDSFKINTPSWINNLPGEKYEGSYPDGFYHLNEFIEYLYKYASRHSLPVKENSKVISLDEGGSDGKFKLKVSANGSTNDYFCSQVVVASGIMNEKTVPSFSSEISPDIFQIHASEYRNPARLPEGAVLVVGSGQSGCQISEDLVGAGRKVYLSTSKVPRAPRRYRGKDTVYWFVKSGFWDVETGNISDPQIFQMRQPQISASGPLGHTLSLQSLTKEGAVILGKLDKANGEIIYFQPNAAGHVRFADESSKKIKDMIDEFILKNGIDAPPPEKDEADEPDLTASCASDITELNLKENGITSIVWTTGFGADFSWIKLPVLDNKGNPKHVNGISEVEGVYFLGFPWLRKRKSGIICGIAEDAEFIAEKIMNCLNS